MNARETVLVAGLLAAGAMLQYLVAPPGLLLTPDIITAFFCLGILLLRPNLPVALLIGLAGGVLSLLIPGSILPWANLASGPAGAYACYYLAESSRDRSDLAPFIATFSATLASGCTFGAVAMAAIATTLLARFGTFGDFIVAYLPIVIGTAVLNAVIVQILVLPAGRFLARKPA